jgi:hypothetical protein
MRNYNAPSVSQKASQLYLDLNVSKKIEIFLLTEGVLLIPCINLLFTGPVHRVGQKGA